MHEPSTWNQKVKQASQQVNQVKGFSWSTKQALARAQWVEWNIGGKTPCNNKRMTKIKQDCKLKGGQWSINTTPIYLLLFI